MREIKFRAYIKEVNKNYPCSVSQNRTNDWSNIAFVEWRDYVDWFNCNIMQYTWLKDKNWKEIYEGDIIQYDIQWITQATYYEVKDMQDIRLQMNRDDPYYCRDENIIVVGNVYENPGLLLFNE